MNNEGNFVTRSIGNTMRKISVNVKWLAPLLTMQ